MGIYTRPDSPYWQLYLETTKRKEPTTILIGTTPTEKHDSRQLALALYHQRMQALAARLYKLPMAQPAIRFDAYATTYARDVIALRKGARREQELLVPLVAYFGDALLTGIDADAVRAYMAARKANTIAPRTINREVDLLKGMLRDAAPKYLNESPIVGLKRLRAPTPRRRLVSPAEARKLLAACEDAQDRAILILGWDTLQRLGDLLDLRRSDRRGRWIFIADPKNDEALEIPLTTRAAKALDAIKGDAVYYFAKFRRAENPRDWPGAVRQRLERLCRKANLPYGRAKDGITFHWGTRRTGATRMLVQEKAPLKVVQHLGGWKQADVLLDIYTEAEKKQVLRAVNRFPSRSRSRRKRA